MVGQPLFSLRSPAPAALLVAAFSAFAIAAAWFFQLVVGLLPCPLCLYQRIPYYMGIPLGLLALVLVLKGHERSGRVLLGVLALAFLVNTGIAFFHAGLEWHLWTVSLSCIGTPESITTDDVLSALKSVQLSQVPRCDEAPWRLFGISMAGWNVPVSAVLAFFAARAAATGRTL